MQELRYRPRLAEMVVESLLEKMDKTEDGRKVREAAAIRVDYLMRLLSLVGNTRLLVLSRDLWRTDFRKYTECLQQAIEFCMKRADGGSGGIAEGDRITLRGPNYNRYNTDFQKLYVPFVLAEALYLERAENAKIALCPTSERGFSRMLRKFAKENGLDSLGDVWFERPPDIVLDCVQGGRPMERITFRDDQDTVRAKLEADIYYAAWMGEVIEPFEPGSMPQPGAGVSIQSLAGRIVSFIDRVNGMP